MEVRRLMVLTTGPLPKSPVGKVLRKLLRKPFWQGTSCSVTGN